MCLPCSPCTVALRGQLGVVLTARMEWEDTAVTLGNASDDLSQARPEAWAISLSKF